MKLSHHIDFDFLLNLPEQTAIEFVRDVEVSLSRASFINNLTVNTDNLIEADIPVNAALFGQQNLEFKSHLVNVEHGARLEPIDINTNAPGWAKVAGHSVVSSAKKGSRVEYRFDITIMLNLPKAEKWGGKALTKMIEFTAQKVLERICSSFPSAVQEAAKELEISFEQVS